jgi:hypothetical protein
MSGAPRKNAIDKLKTLLVMWADTIVMVGDNDAGAFGTYTQAGQGYGTQPVVDTSCCWCLDCCVRQPGDGYLLRLGVVTRVGHADFLSGLAGFWGAFSVIDLFVLNALTIVTEFIGIEWAWVSGRVEVVGIGARGSCPDRCCQHQEFPASGARFAKVLILGSLLNWSRLFS